jgi:hypothetical protein
MISMYEYWIELKLREQQRPWHERTTRRAKKILGEPGAPARPAAPSAGAPAPEPEKAEVVA